MLSERERKSLEEIERHLQEDDRLCAVEVRSKSQARRMHRLWLSLLIASGVLLIGLAVLGSVAGVEGALVLGVVSAIVLYFNPAPGGAG
ncbi:DUF3040 domain-containing protein [Pseudonocardia sp. DLS-67]